MRHALLASTCLFAFATAATAETVIEARRTDPVRTATVRAGQPDDVRITSAGTLAVTGPVAVTIDSANKVTNEGAIEIVNVNGASGILASAGTGGGIVNTGKITLGETYAPADDDKDGDIDGPFAIGSGRAAIRTLGGYAGDIRLGGTLAVNGNDSFGVRLGGPLTGAFVHDGTTGVTGDRATGVRLDAVSGNVRLAGTIAAIGRDAVAARIDGDIAGALVVQGSLGSTGYRLTTAPADASKLDADDLLQGGSALMIGANVAGGVILAVPPRDNSPTDADEDRDGIEDAKEGSASVVSSGAAPAMIVGSATRAVRLGPVAGTASGFGLIVDGAVSGRGVYAGVDATGLAIGGLGGVVSIAGGIGIGGTVEASSAAGATAIRVGADAVTPEIRVSGTVSAAGAAKATAIAVEAGGAVATIRNSGTIKAVVGADGTATAIADRSGSVRLIENSGVISASGATSGSGRAIAIDVSTSGGAVVVRQTEVAAGITAPAITGDIRFGAGNDIFEVNDGTVTGNTSFGAGVNRLSLATDAVYTGNVGFGSGADTLALAGSSALTGIVDFGGGADMLTLAGTAKLTATLVNAQNLAVTATGGMLDIGKGAVIGSLSMGGTSVLGVTLDKSGASATLLQVNGQASFASGAGLQVRVASLTGAEGRYTVIRAGSLSGADTLAIADAALPFLYKAKVAAVSATELAVDVSRKTTTELGLNRSEASAYDATFAALAADGKVATAVLGLTDGASFRGALRSMLPDHAGGLFEGVTSGSRTMARMLSDPKAPFRDEGRWGYWLHQSAWGRNKALGDTAGYDVTGWGFGGGAELKTGIGNVGASLAYLWSKTADKGSDNDVAANQFELAGYFRGRWDRLAAQARISAARIDFEGQRGFVGKVGTENVVRTTGADWKAGLVSASGSVTHESYLGAVTFRPILAVDYYRLTENAYRERGGGKAIDLSVDKRTSDELAVTGSAAIGIDFGADRQSDGWFRIELEGGRRQLVGGALGVTRARFDGGKDFTLTPEERTSGWIGRLRAIGGDAAFRIGGEFGAEQQQDRAALSLRVSLQIGL